MYGFKSYLWFAFKLWFVYCVVSSVLQSIVTKSLYIQAWMDPAFGAMLIAGWFFWKAKFSEQIEQEKKELKENKQPPTIDVEHEEAGE
jgi:hypothetical protein